MKPELFNRMVEALEAARESLIDLRYHAIARPLLSKRLEQIEAVIAEAKGEKT
jgi:hypothetical protein